jgi:MFS family permease
MSLGRLTGDRIVAQIGRKVALFGGLVLAGIGFAIVALAPTPELVWLGYAIVGAGAANVVPILFTLAGNQNAMPSHLAVSAVTTMGYAGFLAGPAIIGFVAQGTSLLASFGLLGFGIFACLPLAQRAVSEHQSAATTS